MLMLEGYILLEAESAMSWCHRAQGSEPTRCILFAIAIDESMCASVRLGSPPPTRATNRRVESIRPVSNFHLDIGGCTVSY